MSISKEFIAVATISLISLAKLLSLYFTAHPAPNPRKADMTPHDLRFTLKYMQSSPPARQQTYRFAHNHDTDSLHSFFSAIEERGTIVK